MHPPRSFHRQNAAALVFTRRRFYEEWCGHCQKLKKHFQKASAEVPGWTWIEVRAWWQLVVPRGEPWEQQVASKQR